MCQALKGVFIIEESNFSLGMLHMCEIGLKVNHLYCIIAQNTNIKFMGFKVLFHYQHVFYTPYYSPNLIVSLTVLREYSKYFF